MASVVSEVRTPRPQTARKAVRAFGVMIILTLVTAGGAGTWFYWKERANLPELDGSLGVAGLAAPVENPRDARGEPHIHAKARGCAAIAQGYVTASDRPWAMGFSRRVGGAERF